MYSAKILLDSVNPAGHRLTTWELQYPRFVHAELMTHRVFSRNSASSRAIPSEKLIQRILDDPAMPVWWGKNQPGMQAQEELGIAKVDAQSVWIGARNKMVEYARMLQELGLHKQIANRILEPWMYITVILSATSFDNWFKLRCHKDAQPEIKHLADMMLEEYKRGNPIPRGYGGWHLPLTNTEDFSTLCAKYYLLSDEDKRKNTNADMLKISVGRCARVSYLTHDGKRDIQADIDLHDRLVTSGHWSPFEHVAQASDGQFGNFTGWRQYRKEFEGESGC